MDLEQTVLPSPEAAGPTLNNAPPACVIDPTVVVARTPTTADFDPRQFLLNFREIAMQRKYPFRGNFAQSELPIVEPVIARASMIFDEEAGKSIYKAPQLNLTEALTEKARQKYLSSARFITNLVLKGQDDMPELYSDFFDENKMTKILEQLMDDFRKSVFLLSDIRTNRKITVSAIRATLPHIHSPQYIRYLFKKYEYYGKSPVVQTLYVRHYDTDETIEAAIGKTKLLRKLARFMSMADRRILSFTLDNPRETASLLQQIDQAENTPDQEISANDFIAAYYIEVNKLQKRTKPNTNPTPYTLEKIHNINTENSPHLEEHIKKVLAKYGAEFTEGHKAKYLEGVNLTISSFTRVCESMSIRGPNVLSKFGVDKDLTTKVYIQLLNNFQEITEIFSEFCGVRIIPPSTFTACRPDIYTPEEIEAKIKELSKHYKPRSILNAFARNIRTPENNLEPLRAKNSTSINEFYADERFTMFPSGKIREAYERFGPQNAERILLHLAKKAAASNQ